LDRKGAKDAKKGLVESVSFWDAKVEGGAGSGMNCLGQGDDFGPQGRKGRKEGFG